MTQLDYGLAEQEGVTDAYVCRLLPLTCLAPDVVEAILDGRQPKGLRLAELLRNTPLGWEGQRGLFRKGVERPSPAPGSCFEPGERADKPGYQ